MISLNRSDWDQIGLNQLILVIPLELASRSTGAFMSSPGVDLPSFLFLHFFIISISGREDPCSFWITTFFPLDRSTQGDWRERISEKYQKNLGKLDLDLLW